MVEWTDWNAAVEKNREALKRVLATLVGMAGPGSGGRFFLFRRKGGSPEDAERRTAGDSLLNSAERHGASGLMRAELSKLSPVLTLPRHLHRAMLMLLRPAEAAARRLIIAAARGLVVELPPPRTPEPIGTEPLPRNLGIAVTMPLADFTGAAEAKPAAASRADRPRTISLPLLDPLKNPFRIRDRYMPAHAMPRILSLGGGSPYCSLPPPPSRDDPIDAARLSLRLEALAAALDDLPAQAERFARWKARNDAAPWQETEGGDAAAQNGTRHTAGPQDKQAGTPIRFRRTRPLKPGRPPGWRRKPTHEVRENLNIVHGLAFRAPKAPDTS